MTSSSRVVLAPAVSMPVSNRQATTTVNPLVLFGAISMSVVLSIILVLYDPGPAGDSTSEQKETMAVVDPDFWTAQ